jgi:hypothetical protein
MKKEKKSISMLLSFKKILPKFLKIGLVINLSFVSVVFADEDLFSKFPVSKLREKRPNG